MQDDNTQQEATDQAVPQDVQAAIEQALAAHEDALLKHVQSALDKRDARLERRMRAQGEIVNRARAVGVSDHQLAALREAGLLADSTDDEDEADEGDGTDAITDAGQELAEAWGLNASDPEVREIITDRSPTEYLQSIVTAGQKKQRRLQQASPAQPPPAQPSQPATSTRNPIANIASAPVLYKLAQASGKLYGKKKGG